MPVGLIGEMGIDIGTIDPCGMPTEWLVRALSNGLSLAGFEGVEVVEGDLYALPKAASDAIVDEMVAGRPFPMVLVGERVACVGGIDVESVVQVLATA